MKIYVHSWYFAQFFPELEIFQTTVVKKMKTQTLFNNFFSENRAVFEITWKIMVKPDRPQIKIQYGAWALHAG
jgi:hypothetical protein